jgi:primosomal protein N' (replication factor Y)
MAAVTGSAAAVAGFLAGTTLPAGAELIGTVPAGEDKVQALIRTPRPGGLALAAALRQAQAARTARKDAGQVRVRLDPADLI